MSTHFTRRGGTPPTPDGRPAEDEARIRDGEGAERERRFTTDGRADASEAEPRFTTDRRAADEAEVPVSPLVAEQQDARMRREAPLRDRQVAPPATGPGGWRSAVSTASGLNVLAGIWLIIAPFVLGYGSGDPYWNDIIFGAITAVIALVRFAGAYREAWLSWINALIGAWVFAAAFWLDGTGTAAINDVIVGAIIFVLAIASAVATDEGTDAERRGLPA